MQIKKFKAKLKHDHETLILHVAATSKRAAITIIQGMENCPKSAIKFVK